MKVTHPSFLPVKNGINIRDMGGQRTSDGHPLRKGKLIRSGALDKLTDEDRLYLDTLPLRYVLDYRDPSEVMHHPDKLGANVHYINAPANPLNAEINARIVEFSASVLEEMDGEAYMLELYRKLPFNNPAYKQLATWLKQPFEGALLQHCAVGKDRTGVGCALTLLALGCNVETVMEEYLLTVGMLAPFEKQIIALAGNTLSPRGRKNLASLLDARESYLGTALAEINSRYSGIDEWLEKEYSLTQLAREDIRSRLLVTD